MVPGPPVADTYVAHRRTRLDVRTARGPLAALASATFLCFLGYHTLLIAVPYHVGAEGGGTIAVGAVTGGFMLAATASPLLLRTTMDRGGSLRGVLAAGVTLLGLSSLVHAAPLGLGATIVTSTVRGFAFGAVAATSATIAPRLVPASRRGTAMGVWGMSSTLSTAFGPPLGVHVVATSGLRGLAIVIGTLTLLVVVLVARLRLADGRGEAAVPALPSPGRSGPRARAWLVPAGLFVVGPMGYGAVVTFAPLMLQERGDGLAVIHLLALGVLIPLSRWAGGAGTDRSLRAAHILGAGAVLTGLGLLPLVSVRHGVSVAIAGVLFGLGFGAMTTASHVLLLSRLGVGAQGTANAVFSATFNAGIGIGSIGFGLLAGAIDLGALFVACAVLLVVVGVVATRAHDTCPPQAQRVGGRGRSRT